MGLTMYVGAYAALRDGTDERDELIQEGLQEMYDALADNGVTPYEEPVEYKEGGPWTCDVRYGFVEELQELVSNLQGQGKIDMSKEQMAHLTEHSPGAGYYMPMDFKEFIETDDLHLGSSPQLKQICEKVLKYLEFPMPPDRIPFDYSGDGDGLWKVLQGLKDKGGKWSENTNMTLIALMLYQGSELSIRNNMLLGFS